MRRKRVLLVNRGVSYASRAESDLDPEPSPRASYTWNPVVAVAGG